MAVELASQPKRNRTRSPSYPYLDLPAALEKAAALWKAEGRHAVAVNVAMQHWGYKEESSTGYSCVAALKKFGLAEHEGIGETRQVRLSNLALTILLDNDPGSAGRRDALRTAALGPRIHAELWERYGAELPSEQSLRRFLVLERSFNEASVDELLAEYQATMAFAGLSVGAVRGASQLTPAPVLPAAFAPLPPIVPVPPLSPVTPPASTPLPSPHVGPIAGTGSGAVVEPDVFEPARRREPPLPAPRMPARATGASATAWNSIPASAPVGEPAPPAATPAAGIRHGAPAGQPGLFDDDLDEVNEFDGSPVVEETLAPVRPARAGQEREAGPWSMARRELPVPLDNDLVARVPYPMTEEDFMLLIDTLQLWKKRLVRPRR